MRPPASTKSIKLSQKESVYLRALSTLLHQAALDSPELGTIFISRVHLSDDAGICTLFFYTPQGEAHFNHVLELLKLYKPSLRKALAAQVHARKTPELLFKFDDKFEKQQHLEELFEKIKTEPS